MKYIIRVHENGEMSTLDLIVQQGNHNADELEVHFPLKTGSISLIDCSFFVIISDTGRPNKIPLETQVDGEIVAHWLLDSSLTMIDTPFLFVSENLAGELVWHTESRTIQVRQTADGDSYVVASYLGLLQNYQKRMDDTNARADATLAKAENGAARAEAAAAQTAQDSANTAAALTEARAIRQEVTDEAAGVHAARAETQKLAEQVEADSSAAQIAAQDAEADREDVAEMHDAVHAVQIAVEALQGEISGVLSNFEDVTLPAAKEAVEAAGQAKADEAKSHADSAAASAAEAKEKLAAINQATDTFSASTLPAAVKTVNDTGAAQIKAVQDEGAAQIALATEQADRAKAEADRAAAIDPYSKAESDARFTPINTVGRVEDLENLLPTTTASGTGAVTLHNCAALTPRSLVVRGAAKQEAYVDFEAITQEVVDKYPDRARIETVDGKRCLVCKANAISNLGKVYYSGAFRAGQEYTTTMTAREYSRIDPARSVSLYIRYILSDGTYVRDAAIDTGNWRTVSITSNQAIRGLGWTYGSDGYVAISIDDFKVTPAIQPTPEHPIRPTFVGDSGALNVELCGKNLCNPDNIIHGYSAGGVIVTGAAQTMVFCPCQPDCTYTICKPPTSRFIIYETYERPDIGIPITQLASSADQTILTAHTSANARYLIAYIHHNTYDTNISVQDAVAQTMTVQGTYTADTMPLYTPYNGESQNAALPCPLVGSGDEVDLVSGRGESVWAKAVLDGTEQWYKSVTTVADGTLFYIQMVSQDETVNRKSVYSTHFVDVPKGAGSRVGMTYQTNVTFFALPNSLLKITADDTDTQKVDKCKAWAAAESAAGRPVTIWYQSTHPTEITAAPHPELAARRGTTNITVTPGAGEPVPGVEATAVQDPNLLILEQQEENKSLKERLDALEAKTLGV